MKKPRKDELLLQELAQAQKERDDYKEQAAQAVAQYRAALEVDLRNQAIARKSKQRVAARCLLVGAAVGAVIGFLVAYLIW